MSRTSSPTRTEAHVLMFAGDPDVILPWTRQVARYQILKSTFYLVFLFPLYFSLYVALETVGIVLTRFSPSSSTPKKKKTDFDVHHAS